MIIILPISFDVSFEKIPSFLLEFISVCVCVRERERESTRVQGWTIRPLIELQLYILAFDQFSDNKKLKGR